ncbi:MAG: hypothetical protein NTY55_02045 [Flavobacteriia bacterium]|nr:hypothetical protein [Flavobacteriia bacterium]
MKKTKNYLFLSIAVIISLAITSCGKYEDGPGFSFMSINEDGYITDGSWDFSNDKEDLHLTIFGEGIVFKIRRLTNKELWLENELEDNELSKWKAQ